MALTARQVATNKAPGRYYDQRGLILQVTGRGGRSWLFRFSRHGKTHDVGLGSAATVSLAGARKLAQQCHAWLEAGKDPIKEREALRAPSGVPTFKLFTEEYIERKKAGWRNPDHTAKQFRQALQHHAFKTIGDRAVDEIAVDHVEAVLKPIWSATPVMADRVRANIEAVLDAALALKYRTAGNPARWRTIKNLFPRPRKVRKPQPHAALPSDQIPALMKELAARRTVVAQALRFTILTACRTQEVIGARWAEFDLPHATWTIPEGRMKSERVHRVPLSKPALAILAAVPREADNEFAFVGQRRGKGLSNIPMLKLMQSLRPGYTVHGCRATFRTWCSEHTSFTREVAEAALAHQLGNAAEQSYARSDLFERRRELMGAWARYCGGKTRT